jgi:hypothetical protein
MSKYRSPTVITTSLTSAPGTRAPVMDHPPTIPRRTPSMASFGNDAISAAEGVGVNGEHVRIPTGQLPIMRIHAVTGIVIWSIHAHGMRTRMGEPRGSHAYRRSISSQRDCDIRRTLG